MKLYILSTVSFLEFKIFRNLNEYLSILTIELGFDSHVNDIQCVYGIVILM